MLKIGIIGSGNIGSGLVHRFRAAGHEVAVANSRGPESLNDLAQETGAQAVSVEQAAQAKDIVVITIPLVKVPDLPPRLFAVASTDFIVIDTCNYYPQQRDGRIEEIEAGLTESGWVEKQLGHPVIKAFNMIAAPKLLNGGKPAGALDRIALAVAGDDASAKANVIALIDEIGFDAVDAGTIAESWRQQPGTPAYGKDLDVQGLQRALGEASADRTPEWQAA